MLRTPEFCRICPDKNSDICVLPSVGERLLTIGANIGGALAMGSGFSHATTELVDAQMRCTDELGLDDQLKNVHVCINRHQETAQ